MNCLRCGRDIDGENVFCNSCRNEMEAYPVKPGTPIQLPHRDEDALAKKKSKRKRPANPEEQIAALKRSLKKSRRFSAFLIILLVFALAVILYQLHHQYYEDSNIGRNYVVDVTQPTE